MSARDQDAGSSAVQQIDAAWLARAFLAMSDVLPGTAARPAKQFYALGELQTAFHALKQPLATVKARGGLINPWALRPVDN